MWATLCQFLVARFSAVWLLANIPTLEIEA